MPKSTLEENRSTRWIKLWTMGKAFLGGNISEFEFTAVVDYHDISRWSRFLSIPIPITQGKTIKWPLAIYIS